MLFAKVILEVVRQLVHNRAVVKLFLMVVVSDAGVEAGLRGEVSELLLIIPGALITISGIFLLYAFDAFFLFFFRRQ